MTSPSHNEIRIQGARQHNLKNVHLTIPRNQLVVFTGVSGSGKSSLAFDTIFAEGQRRYVESLSAYARQFLGQLDKPDVDRIEGLSPAISIDQKSTSHNPRSTVGTVTEIYDYLRLLFGRAGTPYCPHCGRPIAPQTVDQIVDQVMTLPDNTRFQLLAPVVRGKKGSHAQVLSGLASQGFVRVRIDGQVQDLSTAGSLKLAKNQAHDIEVVVDRLVKKPDILERLTDSLSTCLRQSEGIAIVEVLPRDDSEQQAFLKAAEASGHYQYQHGKPTELIFSEKLACPVHGSVMEELSPRLFSFNSPLGACPTCHGLGYVPTFDPDLVVPDPTLPVYAAIAPWAERDNPYYLALLVGAGKAFGFDIRDPWKALTPEQQHKVLYGSEQPVEVPGDGQYRSEGYHRRFEGVIKQLQRHYQETTSEAYRQKLEAYLSNRVCETCQGTRLKPEVLSVRLGGLRMSDLTDVPIDVCLHLLENLDLSPRQAQIADLPLREIRARLQFLLDVGLDYLTLGRAAMTLSGGEAQRIRLATQIGSGLTGVLYVLDEPSIGLHQRDNDRLLETLRRLRDLNNTLIVVEHDEDTIRSADHIVDIGPGAGIHGGEIVAQGSLADIMGCERSITGQYLSGRRQIPTPTERRPGKNQALKLINAHANNLKHITVEIPLGKFVCVTGVSGSGKSTLINELLYPALCHELGLKSTKPSHLEKLLGVKYLDKVIVIDQSPIGRTPRSNPATYTGLFDPIRQAFAQTLEAKARGYQAGHFSFNVKGGRCEACKGQGVNVIEMNFLPDVYVTCDVCHGSRYSRETLQVKYKGKHIADVLDMTVGEAMEFFQGLPPAAKILQTLVDVGLDYIKLGQSAPTLSGGEAQRVKLAAELSRRSTGKTLYLLDEPSTGLSFYDVHKLLDVLQRLVDTGNTVLVIEHNLDIIRCADWIIDLGPEGGSRGGEIVAVGTPEEVAAMPNSHTGRYLKQVLARQTLP